MNRIALLLVLKRRRRNYYTLEGNQTLRKEEVPIALTDIRNIFDPRFFFFRWWGSNFEAITPAKPPPSSSFSSSSSPIFKKQPDSKAFQSVRVAERQASRPDQTKLAVPYTRGPSLILNRQQIRAWFVKALVELKIFRILAVMGDYAAIVNQDLRIDVEFEDFQFSKNKNSTTITSAHSRHIAQFEDQKKKKKKKKEKALSNNISRAEMSLIQTRRRSKKKKTSSITGSSGSPPLSPSSNPTPPTISTRRAYPS
ncbi:hypothetical protein MBM_01777 [Drepanopeziza brunnea f. sp. 'multigermtubi' MB_m1]|uniref:Uncharacterized protein n=1 Tax=Marssonina brunnea f. sp. multigermtubi (strain MB_m1) TaxID=1072389 RepID=K1WQA8_MARBU|nr:uncharacterized protein MBM_01777 [Drepanopeziza brunnea f. sp. 'multigermtubi' MB_m1]EKD19825.1 hypothetical protein MBM_01777 [Drepanopeziza brunnea f. sp. 'multigermtubi' MB_m1]